MRMVARLAYALFPTFVLIAMIAYVHPRPVPREGSLLVTPHVQVLYFPAAALAIHWLSYHALLLRSVVRRRFPTVVGVIGLLMLIAGMLIGAIQSGVAFVMFPLAATTTFALLFWQKEVKRLWVYAAAVGPLAALFSPVLFVVVFFVSSIWQSTSQLRLPDGRIFHVQRFWESALLTQQVSRDALFLRTRVVVENNSEYASVTIVRPDTPAYVFPERTDRAASGKSAGTLVLSTDGQYLVAVFPYESYPSKLPGCATDLVYDLKNGERWGFNLREQSIYNVSPFFLVGTTDGINTGDVEAMLEGYSAYVSAPVDEEVIRSLRSHPNPWVRVAVARWQKTLQADASTLRKNLLREATTAADPAHRSAARGALVWLKKLQANRRRHKPAGKSSSL